MNVSAVWPNLNFSCVINFRSLTSDKCFFSFSVEGAVDLTRFSHVANCDVKGNVKS